MANVTPWTISNSFLQKVDPGISSPNVLHLLECRAFTGTPHRTSDSKGGILHMESDLPLHYTGDNVFHHKWNVMKIWPIMNWTLNSALISSLTCFILHQEKKSLNFVKWVRWVIKSNTKVFLDDFFFLKIATIHQFRESKFDWTCKKTNVDNKIPIYCKHSYLISPLLIENYSFIKWIRRECC